MTEQVKYEAVFGDQSVFNPGDKTTVMVTERTLHPGFQFLEHWDCYKKVLGRDERIIATRRIIKTLVWTKADQEAGKLPEIGCEYIGRGVLLACVFVDKNGDIWGKSKESLMYVHQSSEIKPIETEAERQQREREEWVNHAYEKLISSDVKGKASLGDIYDALVSGELKAPEVKK